MYVKHRIIVVIVSVFVLAEWSALPALAQRATPIGNLLDEQLKDKTRDWSYDSDAKGEQAWGSLKPEWSICETGWQQSPININPALATPADLPALVPHYRISKASVSNDGQTVSAEFSAGNQLILGGEVFVLDRVVFHSPAEHSIGEIPEIVEAQLVHKNMQGNLLILAVRLSEGDSNPSLQKIFKSAAVLKSAAQRAKVEVDPTVILPKDHSYYSYTGSLTAPPCTEGVHWIIFRTPGFLAREEALMLIDMVGRNARSTQVTAGRIINVTRD